MSLAIKVSYTSIFVSHPLISVSSPEVVKCQRQAGGRLFV